MKCVSVCCVPLCQRAALGWWSPLALPAPPSEEPDGNVEWAINATGGHEYWPTATPHLLTGKAYSHTDFPRPVRFDNTHMCLHACADHFCVLFFSFLFLIIRMNRTSFATKTCVMQKHFFFYIIDFVNSMECYKYVNIRPPYTYAFLIRCVSNQFMQMIHPIIFYLLYVNINNYIYLITICIYLYLFIFMSYFFIVNTGGTR